MTNRSIHLEILNSPCYSWSWTFHYQVLSLARCQVPSKTTGYVAPIDWGAPWLQQCPHGLRFRRAAASSLHQEVHLHSFKGLHAHAIARNTQLYKKSPNTSSCIRMTHYRVELTSDDKTSLSHRNHEFWRKSYSKALCGTQKKRLATFFHNWIPHVTHDPDHDHVPLSSANSEAGTFENSKLCSLLYRLRFSMVAAISSSFEIERSLSWFTELNAKEKFGGQSRGGSYT